MSICNPHRPNQEQSNDTTLLRLRERSEKGDVLERFGQGIVKLRARSDDDGRGNALGSGRPAGETTLSERGGLDRRKARRSREMHSPDGIRASSRRGAGARIGLVLDPDLALDLPRSSTLTPCEEARLLGRLGRRLDTKEAETERIAEDRLRRLLPGHDPEFYPRGRTALTRSRLNGVPGIRKM